MGSPFTGSAIDTSSFANLASFTFTQAEFETELEAERRDGFVRL